MDGESGELTEWEDVAGAWAGKSETEGLSWGWQTVCASPCLWNPLPSSVQFSAVDQDVTWYGARPRPRRLCVRWGPSPPPPKGTDLPLSFTPGSRRTSFKNVSYYRLPCGLRTWTLWLDCFFWAFQFLFLVSSLLFFLFGSVRQISWIFVNFLDTHNYSLSYPIVDRMWSSCEWWLMLFHKTVDCVQFYCYFWKNGENTGLRCRLMTVEIYN